MLLKYLDAFLSKILIKEIRDAAIGDLWEAHHLLLKKNKHKALVNLITLWRALTLVSASFQIIIERIGANIPQKDNWLIKQIRSSRRMLIFKNSPFILFILVVLCFCLAIVNKDNQSAYFDIVKIAMAYSFGSMKNETKTNKNYQEQDDT